MPLVDGMHVEVLAEGQGPHLLLVHGICSSRAQWRPNLAGMAQFCRPVVVELLGHGRSASPDDPEAYRVEAYFERFEQLRRSLDAPAWAICGQSFGAGLTLGYALAHPARVTRQVFTNSASALATPNPSVTDEMRRARAQAFLQGGRSALEKMPFYPKRTGRLAKAVEDELVADAALISPAGVAHALAVTIPGLAVTPRLAEITTPTLLVNGRREAAFQPLRDLAAREIAGIEIADLDGGHPINLDQPEAFNAAVRSFLAADRSAAGNRS